MNDNFIMGILLFFCLVLIYLLYKTRKDIKQLNDKITSSNSHSSSNNGVEGNKKKDNTDFVNTLNDLVKDFQKPKLYPVTLPNDWINTVYSLKNNWVNATATATLKDITSCHGDKAAVLIAIVKMVNTRPNGNIQLVLEDPTDRITTEPINLGTNGTDLVNRVVIVHAQVINGKLNIKRVKRTIYERYIA